MTLIAIPLVLLGAYILWGVHGLGIVAFLLGLLLLL